MSKYVPPLEVMEKYVKKIEEKWLSKIKIMTYKVNKPYRTLTSIEYDTQKYDLVLVKRKWKTKLK